MPVPSRLPSGLRHRLRRQALWWLVPWACATSGSLAAQSTWREVPCRVARDGAAGAADPVRGQVVWFGGDDGQRLLADTWRWQQGSFTPATAGPAARRDAVLVFDPLRQELLLFGGRGAHGPLADTWRFDGSQWLPVTTPVAPAARAGAGAAWHAASARLVLFGGQGQQVPLGDTWTWNGTAWQLAAASGGPSPRRGHAVAADAAGVVVFGGEAATGLRNDTWRWNGTQWLNPAPSPAPGPRSQAAATTLPNGDLLLLGGRTALGASDEAWRWNGSAWSLEVQAVGGPPRAGASATVDPGSGGVVALGGVDDHGGRDGALRGWTAGLWQVLAGPACPPARRGGAMLAGEAHGDVLLYGGATRAGQELADVWQLDGDHWHEVTAPGPGPRQQAAWAWSAGDGGALLFGGSSGGTVLGDTWVWAAGSWSIRVPGAAPAPRQAAAMTTHPHGGLLLFGGLGSAFAPLGDAWRWHAGGWQSSSGPAPSARYGHSMAFDRARGDVVLFGGRSASAWLGDTWTFDGSQWQLQAGIGPTPRAYARLTDAASRQRLLLVGGLDANLTPRADCFEWDGLQWHQVATTAPPVAHSDGQLAHQAGTGRVVLFGGDDGNADVALTTGFAALVPARSEPLGASCQTPRPMLELGPAPHSLPWLGDRFDLLVTGLPPGPGLAIVLFGLGEQQFLGQPLPQSLAPFGMPQCQLWIEPVASLAVGYGTVGPNTVATISFTIPSAPVWRGSSYRAQALALDPGYANAAGAATSNAVRNTVGAR